MSGGSDGLSRRRFIQAAAGSLALPSMPQSIVQAQLRPAFSTGAAPRSISENLFVLEDTCNVYLVRDGDHGLLIDFGSGKMLEHLDALGVSRVDCILHTHFHRDQAQGDQLAVAQQIPIAVPAHERHLFESVERLWSNRRLFELYEVRNDFFSLTQNIPVAAVLADYDTFRWRGYEFFIQPTPGHTPGSISLISKLDGRTTAFVGDLMHSPGKVKTLYDLQYAYELHEGADLSVYSLDAVMKLKPELLCPSHGAEVFDPIPGMRDLSEKLRGWYLYWHGPGAQTTIEFEPIQVTSHLLAHPLAFSTFYAIISDSGKALFVDYGSASMNFFISFRDADDTYNHVRFVEHSIDKLREKHGLRSIDVMIPSHMHDDHLNGFPHLARRYGTKTWCYENMVSILEDPRANLLGCTFGEPIHVDRALQDNETFHWEEFEFTICHSPGHTEYQSALFATIDGVSIAFTGDAFFSYDKKQLHHNLIYRNQVKMGDYARSLRNLVEKKPTMIAPGHGEPFALTQQMLDDFAERLRRQDAFFTGLIAEPEVDFGLDPAWLRISPYQATAIAGEAAKMEIRVRNYSAAPMELEVALTLPAGWRSSPDRVKFSAGPKGSATAAIRVVLPADAPPGRRAIAADVLCNGRYLGQIAEAVVDVEVRRGIRDAAG